MIRIWFTEERRGRGGGRRREEGRGGGRRREEGNICIFLNYIHSIIVA